MLENHWVSSMAVSTPSYQRLEEEVLHLPRVDRSHLAARLLESLDQDEHEPSSEWIEELRRRVGDIDAGRFNSLLDDLDADAFLEKNRSDQDKTSLR
jgi:putative addiction module component (TIGR02574 family)